LVGDDEIVEQAALFSPESIAAGVERQEPQNADRN
jgi:hypothetical protein